MIIVMEMGKDYHRIVGELDGMGQAVVEACSAGMAKGVKYASAKVVSEHMTGQDLQRRSGALSNAIDGWLAAELEGVVGVLENSAVDRYKWILGTEQKTIRPKNAKYLTIPFGEGLTSAGVARFSSPREVPDGFFFKGRSGGLFFGVKRGKRGRPRPLFILKREVTITGSGALLAGVLDSLDEIAEAMTDEIERKVN